MNDIAMPKNLEFSPEEYTKLVYEQALVTPVDIIAAETSSTVVTNTILDVKVAVHTDAEGNKVLQTYAKPDRHEQALQAALFQGVHSLVTRHIEKTIVERGSETAASEAEGIAVAAVNQIADVPQLMEAFTNYYGGLRWSGDADRFVNDLFTHSVDFDIDYATNQITPSELVSIIYALELTDEIPYSAYKDWRKGEKETADIFKEYPQLDPSRLADTSYGASEEGLKLKQAYATQKGTMLAETYRSTRSYIRTGDSLPVIPLQHYPLVESLMIDTVANQSLKSKYNFGPSNVHELVLASDSVAAQRSLVEALLQRLPVGERHVFDGPSELEQKHGNVLAIVRAFERERNTDRKQEFQDQLVALLAGYTNEGAIAASVRAEYRIYIDRGMDYHPDVGKLKDIVKTIMIAGLGSHNPEPFIKQYNTRHTEGTVDLIGEDPLALDRRDLIEITMKTLAHSDEKMNLATFENFAREAFGNEEFASELRKIAELRAESSVLFDSPDVKLAREALRNSRNDTQKSAREAYDIAAEPSARLFNQAHIALNEFIFDRLRDYINSPDTQVDDGFSLSIMKDLIKDIYLDRSFDSTDLPESYQALETLLMNENTPISLKSSLLWHLSESTKYSGEKTDHLYLDVVLRGYAAVLGLPEELTVTSETSNALAALNNIASSHNIFRFAGIEQIEALNRYKFAFEQLMIRIEAGRLLPLDAEPTKGFDELKFEVEYTQRTFAQLEKQYESYLHMEAVKTEPNVYYEWVLRTMLPFWSGMNWEVGEGQRPTPAVRQLFEVLKDHVDHKLVFKKEAADYGEDFDVLEQGNIGSLLYECYQRMVPNSDIQYNTTVWQKGLSFTSQAVRYMPESVATQIKAKYSDKPNFVTYIDNVRAS